jgi:hypothetical protein
VREGIMFQTINIASDRIELTHKFFILYTLNNFIFQ